MVLQSSKSDQKSFIEDTPDLNTEQDKVSELSEKIGTDFTYKHKIKWFNLIGYILYHITFFMGAFVYLTFRIHFLTFLYSTLLIFITVPGINMGAHRFFTHRAFKVTTTLRRVLIILFIMNGQNSLWEWVRNHRQHHKYSDTDADPHNAKRGLFFSHIGWFLSYKNPKVIQYGKGMDMSDINADSWIMFQRKHFVLVHCIVTILIPCIIPVLFWNEDPMKTFLVTYCARTCLILNFTCCVNSFAHAYGSKPYDKSIVPVENKFVSLLSNGEGWHNYHHVFPWDYRTSELGMPYNLTTIIIDWCAKKGWVYDLKSASVESIKKRMERTGEKVL